MKLCILILSLATISCGSTSKKKKAGADATQIEDIPNPIVDPAEEARSPEEELPGSYQLEANSNVGLNITSDLRVQTSLLLPDDAVGADEGQSLNPIFSNKLSASPEDSYFSVLGIYGNDNTIEARFVSLEEGQKLEVTILYPVYDQECETKGAKPDVAQNGDNDDLPAPCLSFTDKTLKLDFIRVGK